MTRWDVLIVATKQQARAVEEYRVRLMIQKGKLTPEDSIRKVGTADWIKVRDLTPGHWSDPIPSDEERRRLRVEREKSKEEQRASAPAPVEGIQPDPYAPTLAEVPPVAEMVEGEAAEEAFLIGPAPIPEEPPRRPRITPPPLRRVARDKDDDDAPLTLGRKRQEEELDLTAMVDVTFLLILFFMVTASYSLQKALEVPNPDADEQSAQQAVSLEDLRDDNLIVEITADNEVLLNDRVVPARELAELMRAEIRQTGLNEVIIRASGSAHHETVVQAFDAANEVGVQRIRLASAEDSEPPG